MWIARRLGFTTTNQTLKWAKSNEKYRKYNIYLEYYEKWQPKMKLVKEEF